MNNIINQSIQNIQKSQNLVTKIENELKKGTKGNKGSKGIPGGLQVCGETYETVQEKKAFQRSLNYLDLKPPFINDD